MRALFVALVLAPTLASAETKLPSLHNDVHEGRVINRDMPRPQHLSISRKLFVNKCAGGCQVTSASFGSDSSLNNRSSIPRSAVGTQHTLTAYRWGDDHFNQVIECVQDTFAMFDIEVITEDPGPSVAHHEVMAAGVAEDIAYSDAGGVAPFIDCGATADNTLVFVFANQTNDIQYLCGAIAHEAGHAWGLTHSLDEDDPMTYKELGSLKSWQNSNAECGTDTAIQCECTNVGGTGSSFEQNTFKYLRTQFGLESTLADTIVAIDRPSDGQTVRPNFPISARYESPLELNSGSVSIDGQPFQQLGEKHSLFAWAAPDLTPGEHTLTFSAVDEADRTATVQVRVNVMQGCANGETCAAGTQCFQELCQPLTGAGSFGASCTDNLDCVTGTCASDGTDSLCTAQCEAGACPSGFECLSSNLCWPAESGGCNTSSSRSSAPMFLLLALAGLFVSRRRTVRG